MDLFSQKLNALSQDSGNPDSVAELVVTALGSNGSFYMCWRTNSGQYRQDGHNLPPELEKWLFAPGNQTRHFPSLQVILTGESEFFAADRDGKIESKTPDRPQLERAVTFANDTPTRAEGVRRDDARSQRRRSSTMSASTIGTESSGRTSWRTSGTSLSSVGDPVSPVEAKRAPVPISFRSRRPRPRAMILDAATGNKEPAPGVSPLRHRPSASMSSLPAIPSPPPMPTPTPTMPKSLVSPPCSCGCHASATPTAKSSLGLGAPVQLAQPKANYVDVEVQTDPDPEPPRRSRRDESPYSDISYQTTWEPRLYYDAGVAESLLEWGEEVVLLEPDVWGGEIGKQPMLGESYQLGDCLL